MNSEQHRRLIGNDVAFVIFHDSPQPYDPNPLDTLGTVPHIFAVVQPFEENYRYALNEMNSGCVHEVEL
jgi:hypothetical protein